MSIVGGFFSPSSLCGRRKGIGKECSGGERGQLLVDLGGGGRMLLELDSGRQS